MRIKGGFWDVGTKLHAKDVRIVQGILNGAENATATLGLYTDGQGAADRTHAFTPNQRNVTNAVRVEGDTIGWEMVYTHRTGPILFGGFSMDLFVPDRKRA